MIPHSVVEPFETSTPTTMKAQEELDVLDSTFNEFILLFPEAFVNAEVYHQASELGEIKSILSATKTDMEQLDLKLKSMTADMREVNTLFSEEEEILEDVFISLDERLHKINPSNTSSRLKTDKLHVYRYSIVKTVYLLAGIGIMSGTLYHLIK